MKIKEFIRPTWWKIIFTIVFTIVFYLYSINNLAVDCPDSVGYDCSGPVRDAENIVLIKTLIWVVPFYLISCLITLIINKNNKK